jgi:hypothetical protein
MLSWAFQRSRRDVDGVRGLSGWQAQLGRREFVHHVRGRPVE